MPTDTDDVRRILYPSTSSDEDELPNLTLDSINIEDFRTERYNMTFQRESIKNQTEKSMKDTMTDSPAPCIFQQTIDDAYIMEFGEPTNDKVIEYVASDVVAGNRSALTFAVRMVKDNLSDEKVDGIKKRRLREGCEYACYKEMDII